MVTTRRASPSSAELSSEGVVDPLSLSPELPSEGVVDPLSLSPGVSSDSDGMFKSFNEIDITDLILAFAYPSTKLDVSSLPPMT